MIRFVENINPESDIAYFVSFAERGAEKLSQPSVADLADIRQAQERLDHPGGYPDVDLIMTVLEQGVVRQIHKRALQRHIGALDAPVDEFVNDLYDAEEGGRIDPELTASAVNAVSVDWQDYTVLTKDGIVAEVDELGKAQPYIVTEDDADLKSVDESVAQVAREFGLNSFIFQTELEWRDGKPVVLHDEPPAFGYHFTLGRTDADGSFIPVVSVI